MSDLKQPALIDEQLRELRARVAAVRILADRVRAAAAGLDAAQRTNDPVAVRLLTDVVARLGDASETAAALADAVTDLDASLLAGNALPSEWRDPGHESLVDRLTWICAGVWSRLAGKAVRVELARATDAEDDTTGWMAFCDAAPRSVYGPTATAALRLLALYGAEEVTRMHGPDDAAAATAEARLAEVGLARTPGESVPAAPAPDPAAPWWTSVLSRAAGANLAELLRQPPDRAEK